MTEDGRIHRMAALCGRSLNLLRGWGKSDARWDAVTNSLWLVSAVDPARALNPCFNVETSAYASYPMSQKRGMGHPPLASRNPGFTVETRVTLAHSNLALLEEISYEDLP